MGMRLRVGLTSIVLGAILALGASASAGAGTSAGPPTPAGVVALTRQAVADYGLNAAIVRVDVGGRRFVSTAAGDSMTGVPATTAMRFRVGSMAIPYIPILALQLRDAGRLSMDDTVSKWFPDYPHADRITLAMLANSTSGYYDFIQGNPAFQAALAANEFRQWSQEELLDVAFGRGMACDPGTCFNYAHTNFIVLSQIIHAVTGKSVAKLMRRRVLRPLGLTHTQISVKPSIPSPVLHAFAPDRGPYEDSTFWSPSWAISPGALWTQDVRDATRSARAVGTGELLSKRSRREQFANLTAGLAPFDQTNYYGYGVVVTNGWRFQNPYFNGWTGINAYLPSERISLAIVTTQGEEASATSTHFAAKIFSQLGAYLAPGQPPHLP